MQLFDTKVVFADTQMRASGRNQYEIGAHPGATHGRRVDIAGHHSPILQPHQLIERQVELGVMANRQYVR